jgi:gliding motility-associated-like protein
MYHVALKSLFFSLLLLSTQFAQSQGEADNWYFGQYSAMNFTSTGPVNVTGSAISTQEGNATISDASGNLLFYTDGGTVWNANNAVMTNGTGLMGNFSSTQSAVIVPKPGSTTNYYIFTVPATSGTNGLRYSEVDMSQSSGLGSVLTLNKNTYLTGPVREKITAVGHANGTDYWIITQLSNVGTYHAYQISSTGVNATPVVSNITAGSNTSYIGYLKVSPSGDKLVNVQYNSSELIFMDFNNATGVVSNPFVLSGANAVQSNYGGDFSPDETKFYTCSRTQVVQYDISTYTQAAVSASRTVVATPTGTTPSMWAIQLGPDEKLYVVNYQQTFVSQIPNPNLSGTACGFNYQFLTLSTVGQTAHGRLGLPTFIQSFFAPVNMSISDTCKGDTTKFVTGNNAQIDSVLWNFGDPMSGSLNTDTARNASHVYADTGTYYVWLRLHLTNANGLTQIDTLRDTITIHLPPIVNLGNDTTICNQDTLSFTVNTDLYTNLWIDSSSGPKLVVDSAGDYWVRVENVCGFDYDTIRIDSLYPDTIYLGPDTVLCLGDTLNFDVTTIGNTQYFWQDSSTLPTYTVDTTGYYSVQLTNVCGTFQDIIHVDYERPPLVDLGNDTTVCDGVILLKNVVFSRSTYRWQNGSQSSLANIFSPGGTYWVEVTNQCGVASDTLEVAYDYPLNLNLGPDAVICIGDTVVLNPGFTNGGNYRWWSGSQDSTEKASLAGLYWVEVSNTCGLYSDSVEFENVRIPVISLPEDTIFCIGNSLDLSVTFSRSTYRWSNGSTDTSINVSTAGKVWAEATNLCGIGSDTMEIFIDEPLVIDLGPDQTLCNTNTLTLDVTSPNDPTYWWNVGTSGPTYTITETGVYEVNVMNTCGTYSDEIRVVYEYTPNIWLGPDTTICEGRNFRIALPPLQNADVTWSDGSKFDVIEVSTPGIYSVMATNICGTGSDEIEVFYSENPRFNLGEDRLICPGENVELSAFIDDGGSYSYWWNTNEFHPTIFVSDPGDYGVSVENEFGCVSTDTVTLQLCDQYVYIPSAFTPNLDGLNEVFKIYGERLSEVDVVLTNRWGERVYEANGADFAWDGTYRGEPCEIGVYTYQITYPDLNNQLQIRTGTFSLIR